MPRRPALLVALLAAAALAQPAAAAVVCQKGKKVRLRAEACKAKETPVARLGGDDLAGVWESTGGTLLDYSSLALQYLVLEADGSGRLHLAGGDGPVVACAPLAWSRDPNGTIVVDDWGFVSNTRVYRYVIAGDELELTGAVGNAGTFARASAVDPSVDCGELAQAARFTGLPRPDRASGLAFDGTDLWYKEDDLDRIVPVDPGSGSAGAPLALDPAFVHAAQGADFWAHCNCGGNDEAIRVNRAGADVDVVDTGPELGEELSVEAIAYDPAAAALWIHGWNDAGQGRLLEVDASGEPDALVAGFDLDANVHGLTVSGNALWAVERSTQSVIRIDKATGQVTGTFLIPDRIPSWNAIAAVGDQLFLLGELNEGGVLLVVANPD